MAVSKMGSSSQQFLEALEVVRNARHTPEVRAVLKLLQILEVGAVEELVSGSKDQHDTHAGRVTLLRKLQSHIVDPTFAERQAAYK